MSEYKRKFRRDEVAAALREAASLRAPGRSIDAINFIAAELGLENYSDPGADYNAPGHQSETARRASWANLPRAGSQRRAVLRQLMLVPMTDQEIEDRLEIPSSSARTRRAELVAGGWVEATDRYRWTEFGNRAIVWRATDRAERELPHG